MLDVHILKEDYFRQPSTTKGFLEYIKKITEYVNILLTYAWCPCIILLKH